MNNLFKIYWLTRLDYLQGISLFVALIAFSVILFYFIIRFNECYDSEDRQDFDKEHGYYRRISIISIILSCFVLVFVPSKNDMILIYAGGKTLNYIEADTSLSKLPYQTTLFISEYLDKAVKEVKR